MGDTENMERQPTYMEDREHREVINKYAGKRTWGGNQHIWRVKNMSR